jgi:hypothetical protein
MKKLFLIAVLALSSSLAHASGGDAVPGHDFDFWAWAASLFASPTDATTHYIVNSDGTIYDRPQGVGAI